MSMKLSPRGQAVLKDFEGCCLTAYNDEAGVLTIGYGDTRDVVAGMVITQEEAERRFYLRVAEFERAVNKHVMRPPTQPQFDALVCFAYNVGIGNAAVPGNGFAGSTMLKRYNVGHTPEMIREWGSWVNVTRRKPDGSRVKVVSKVLVRRRFAELALFFS